MPTDPDVHGQRLQLQKPSAMSDPRIKALFTFLINSYNGVLPVDQRFRLKHESRHLNLPSPAAPEDPTIHYAASIAAKTKILHSHKQRAGGSNNAKGGRGKVVIEMPPEDDEYQDLPGLVVEEDAAVLDQALGIGNGKLSAPKRLKSSKLRIESPPPKANDDNDRSTATERPSIPPAETTTGATRSCPRPKTVLDPANDELSHKRFIPGTMVNSAVWSKVCVPNAQAGGLHSCIVIQTKSNLDQWGENMRFVENQARTMPFLGLSGDRPDLQLPSGLNAAFSILQMWHAYQLPVSPPVSTPQLAMWMFADNPL